MMTRKKKRILIVTLIVIFILIIISILITIYMTTDMFKSDATLFNKYMQQGIEKIGNLYNDVGENNNNDLSKEHKYQSETELRVNCIENIGTTLESTQNPINKLKLRIEGQTDKKNNYNYKDINLINDKKKVSEIKYIQNDNTYGIQFADMFIQYVTVNNENLKNMFKAIGLSEEQLENIPDKIEVNNDFYNILKFSEKEIEDIKERYSKIIINNILQNNFSKQKSQTIQISENDIQVNEYILTLTKEQINNIYIKLLEELKQDETILSKIDNIQNVLNQYSVIFGDIKNIRDVFITEVEYLIEDINKSNIGQDECKIIVYENEGTTVKLKIQGIGYEINIDLLPIDTEKYLCISYKDVENENEQIFTYSKNSKTNITFENITDGQKSKYTILSDEKISGGNNERNINIKYEDETNKVEMNIKQTIKIVQNFENEEILNNENSVNLSDLQQEQIRAIIDRIKTAVTEKANEIQETVITERDLKDVLIKAGLVEEVQTIEGTGITEAERNRFNSKFEILQGENLEREDILNVIDAIKDNLIGLETISETQLSLKIDRYNKDEEIATTISTFIKNNKNKKYNVEIKYDEETGLVNSILLTLIKTN